MSNLTLVEILLTIFQSGVLVFIIANTVPLVHGSKSYFLPFFFALSMASRLLSNFYWIAYDILRPDSRMPIACNEIGECAMILLLSAGLDSVLKDKKIAIGEVVFAILFTCANIAAWIAWSGEWFQDVLFGIPYAYFIWLLIRGLKSRGCLTRKELWFSSATAVFVLVMQIPLLIVKGSLFEFTKIVFFVVIFAMMGWFGIKSFQSKDFFVASAFFLWTELAMFLTSGVFYYIVFAANVLVLPLLFISMKKELADDLC